jgi:peptidoglycan/LPS O-acetylase OafA/YrhL
LLALFFGAVICLCLNLKSEGMASRFLTSNFMRLLGRLSYAIYLFNFPLRAVIRDTFYGPSKFMMVFGSQLPGQFIFYVMATSVTIVAAWVSWHLWEMPFLRLKRFFPMPEK